MNRLWLCALVLGFGVGAVSAEEKKKPDPEMAFKKMDKNSDGFLSLEEFLGKRAEDPEKKAKAEKQFAAKDKDKDMKLSLEEFKAMPMKKKP